MGEHVAVSPNGLVDTIVKSQLGAACRHMAKVCVVDTLPMMAVRADAAGVTTHGLHVKDVLRRIKNGIQILHAVVPKVKGLKFPDSMVMILDGVFNRKLDD